MPRSRNARIRPALPRFPQNAAASSAITGSAPEVIRLSYGYFATRELLEIARDELQRLRNRPIDRKLKK